jgi:AcrR family transcriptional regulator
MRGVLPGRSRADVFVMRVWLGLAGTLLACACVLLFATAPASAFVTHPYLSQFNGSLTPAGIFYPSSGGVAINQRTGYVYVADFNSGVVDVFNADGEYKSQLMQADGITPYTFSDEFVGSIAVNQATGQIYVVHIAGGGTGNDRIIVFSAAGVYQTQLGSGFEATPEELAVDDSTGEIYAAGDRGVIALSSTGAYLTSFGQGERAAVAVDQASHDVYVTNQIQSHQAVWKGTVEKLTSSGTHISTLTQAKIQRSRLLTGAVRAVEEFGYAHTTVSHITRRARVSRRTFYELFENREDCLLAVFDHVVGVIALELAAADLGRLGWRERVRGGLWVIPSFFDREPVLARVCVAQALHGGPRVFERREEIVAGLAAVLDGGRLERVGLATNSGGHAKGEPNAWTLTAKGREVVQALRTHTHYQKEAA